MNFTEETIDYDKMNFTSKVYPWKFCTEDDFLRIDNRENKDKQVKHYHNVKKLWNSWKGYTLICPDESDRSPIELFSDRGSMYSKHMRFNIRMCSKE